MAEMKAKISDIEKMKKQEVSLVQIDDADKERELEDEDLNEKQQEEEVQPERPVDHKMTSTTDQDLETIGFADSGALEAEAVQIDPAEMRKKKLKEQKI